MSRTWCRNWFVVAMLMLGGVFYIHDQVTPLHLFIATAFVSIGAGVMLGGWVRDHY